MQDFIGQPITEGDWLVGGSQSNTSCEYGMILHRVLAVVGGKLKLLRIRVSYPDQKALARPAKVTAPNPNKYIVANPSPKVVALFERVKNGTANRKDHDLCGVWLHGQKQDIWT